MIAPTTTTNIFTPTHAHNTPGLNLILQEAPFDPASTQSLHADCISTINASLSGLSCPCSPYESGFTTGVSHPSDVRWLYPSKDEEESEREVVTLEEVLIRVMRVFSANGIYLTWFDMTAARYTVLARRAVEDAS
jgi:hypothetical protein